MLCSILSCLKMICRFILHLFGAQIQFCLWSLRLTKVILYILGTESVSSDFMQTDYYAHPDHYYPVFHEKIAPYASVIGKILLYLLINQVICIFSYL